MTANEREVMKNEILQVLDNARAEIVRKTFLKTTYKSNPYFKAEDLNKVQNDALNKMYAEFDNWFSFVSTQEF